MIVYLEDQEYEFCVYLQSKFIDSRHKSYFFIRLTKNLDRIKKQLATVDQDYFYIEKDDLKYYL